VSAPDDADGVGSVHIYSLAGGSYYQRMGSKQMLSDDTSASHLGAAVAMDASGTQMVIGGQKATQQHWRNMHKDRSGWGTAH